MAKCNQLTCLLLKG